MVVISIPTMKLLVLVMAVLGSFSPTSGFLFPSKCTDKYLNEVNLLKKNPSAPTKAKSIYDFFAKDIDGNDVSLNKYRGDVLIVVNSASG